MYEFLSVPWGGTNLKVTEYKEFKERTSEEIGYITTITLDRNYKLAHISTANNASGDDTMEYVALNGIKQSGQYVEYGSHMAIKSVILNDLKAGDTITVGGLGVGEFYA